MFAILIVDMNIKRFGEKLFPNVFCYFVRDTLSKHLSKCLNVCKRDGFRRRKKVIIDYGLNIVKYDTMEKQESRINFHVRIPSYVLRANCVSYIMELGLQND